MTVRYVVSVSLAVLALTVLPVVDAAAQTAGEVFASPDPPEAGIPAGEAALRLAQPPTGKPDAFGTGGQWMNIHASSFVPWTGAVAPSYVSGTGYVTPTDTGLAYFPAFWAQIDLPNGAQIIQVYARLYDATPNASWKMAVMAYEADLSPDYVMYSSTQMDLDSQPGYCVLYASFSAYPLVRAWADLDGDGLEGDLAFTANLLPQGTVSDYFDTLRFWGVAVNWVRTISPAPAAATFSDVPTDHWAFRFVEALAGSGITAGCGGGNYCPDDPVTRGQMAVYLATALGLHWNL